jgi:hypothetical protein
MPPISIQWFGLPAGRGCIAAVDPQMSAMAVALQDWVERGITPKPRQ